MTIRNKLKLLPSSAATRGLALTTLALSLGACTAIGDLLEGNKVDYKTAQKASTLDVPPDLTQLAKDNRYSIPDSGEGVATASGYQKQLGGNGATAAPVEKIGVTSTPNVRVERDGNTRWLVVKQTPEQLWPVLKSFWQDSGLPIASEQPAAGIMETDWAENRAKVPQDIIRSTIGKVFDSLYATGERDKYRTRLERNADGTTDIYISHQGLEEVLQGAQKESVTWAHRPSDPSLEVEFLTKLMVRLGSDAPVAKAAVANAVVQPQHAKLNSGKDGKSIALDEGFDRAWRRVGLALDRVGFTVEDRDRTQGIYFVRFVDPDAIKEQGFFAKLFSSDDKSKEAQRYRIVVKGATGETNSVLTVQNNEGKPDASVTSDKILNLLTEQLK